MNLSDQLAQLFSDPPEHDPYTQGVLDALGEVTLLLGETLTSTSGLDPFTAVETDRARLLRRVEEMKDAAGDGAHPLRKIVARD